MFNRRRFVAAMLAACLSGVACIATLVEPQWFELLFDEAPDGGDGSLETIIAAVVSVAACVVFALLARREWRRDLRDAAAPGEVLARR